MLNKSSKRKRLKSLTKIRKPLSKILLFCNSVLREKIAVANSSHLLPQVDDDVLIKWHEAACSRILQGSKLMLLTFENVEFNKFSFRHRRWEKCKTSWALFIARVLAEHTGRRTSMLIFIFPLNYTNCHAEERVEAAIMRGF